MTEAREYKCIQVHYHVGSEFSVPGFLAVKCQVQWHSRVSGFIPFLFVFFLDHAFGLIDVLDIFILHD